METDNRQGIRPIDVLLTLVLSALGSVLMVANILSHGPTTRVDSRSWLLVPVMLVATLPVLWWRRRIVSVLVVSCLAMGAHVWLFGWLVRCGSGLPLVFVLVFLGGLARDLRRALATLALGGVLGSLVLARDSAAGPGLIPVALILLAGLFTISRVVVHRAELARDLRQRNEDLRVLRNERAALEVVDDRAQLSAQLETLLDRRLSQLASAAESGAAIHDPRAVKALLATLEEDSRETLGDMREIVGLLRGGEPSLAPVPSVAHLDALLARRHRVGSRLRVTGDPRVLPPSVELSAYRIVEHLVTALADSPAPVDVGLRFDDHDLEIEVSGPVARSADLRAATGRARERTRLHAGSLEVKVARGQARVVAHLPVVAGA